MASAGWSRNPDRREGHDDRDVIRGLGPPEWIIGADGQARLVLADRTLAFSFGGWTRPEARSISEVVEVLTPPTSVRALASGFTPVLPPSTGWLLQS